jgi:hypothetical protein
MQSKPLFKRCLNLKPKSITPARHIHTSDESEWHPSLSAKTSQMCVLRVSGQRYYLAKKPCLAIFKYNKVEGLVEESILAVSHPTCVTRLVIQKSIEPSCQ